MALGLLAGALFRTLAAQALLHDAADQSAADIHPVPAGMIGKMPIAALVLARDIARLIIPDDGTVAPKTQSVSAEKMRNIC